MNGRCCRSTDVPVAATCPPRRSKALLDRWFRRCPPWARPVTPASPQPAVQGHLTGNVLGGAGSGPVQPTSRLSQNVVQAGRHSGDLVIVVVAVHHPHARIVGDQDGAHLLLGQHYHGVLAGAGAAVGLDHLKGMAV